MKNVIRSLCLFVFLSSNTLLYAQKINPFRLTQVQIDSLSGKASRIIARYNLKNLKSLSQKERESLLIARATEAVLIYGPDYYRMDQIPEVTYSVMDSTLTSVTENIGRGSYSIIFGYDPAKEKLEEKFAVKVNIWEDTGEIGFIYFGNNLGLIFDKHINGLSELEVRKDFKNGKREPISYDPSKY